MKTASRIPSPELYPGTELELFAQATNWKDYLSRQIRPHLQGNVLEVGAGIGGNTKLLETSTIASWTSLEPASALYTQLIRNLKSHSFSYPTIAIQGTIQGLPKAKKFDCILYIDVLEHILNDQGELQIVSEMLNNSGKLIILVPAHQWLYCEFDKAIGHYRRYSASQLRSTIPPNLNLIALKHLDAIGLLASLSNRMLLKKSEPSLTQIRIWDSVLVKASRFIDPLLNYRLGKSILGIWQK